MKVVKTGTHRRMPLIRVSLLELVEYAFRFSLINCLMKIMVFWLLSL